MHEQDRDPYEVYQDGYYTVRRDLPEDVDEEEVEDVLLGVMGQQQEKIPEHLQAVHDFVRRSLEEKKVPMNWVMKAEAQTRAVVKCQRIIMAVGRAVGATMVFQSYEEGEGTLDQSTLGGFRERIGQGIMESIFHSMPEVMHLLSPEQFSSITVHVIDIGSNQYAGRISGVWKHPVHGRTIPIAGLVRVDANYLTKEGDGQ